MPAIGDNSRSALIDGLNGLLADHLAFPIKTRNLHRHVTGSVLANTRVKDQDYATRPAEAMMAELRDNNAGLVARLREVKGHAEAAGDNATEGLVDDWTEMAGERAWVRCSRRMEPAHIRTSCGARAH